MAKTRTYPHVDGITDPKLKEAVRILFDRVFDLDDQVTATNALAATQAAELTDVNTRLTTAERNVVEGSAPSGAITVPGGVIGPPGLPPGIDDGNAAAGCAQAGTNGHIGTGFRRETAANRAGRICCGTGNEFPSLLVATVDLPTREANADELLDRMIWHLANGSGDPTINAFQAGRQRNPSGAISKDKVAILISGIWRAYDVFLGLDDFASVMATSMQEVFPADPIPSGGISD